MCTKVAKMSSFLRIFFGIFLLSFLMSAQEASAGVAIPKMGPYRYLRKLSQKIRGQDPTLVEYSELKSLISAQQDTSDFFNKKIEAYLASDEFVHLMVFRLEELLRFEPVFLPKSNRNHFDFEESYKKHFNTSTYGLVLEMLQEDRPWDDLLLGKSYPYSYGGEDFEFFKDIRSSSQDPSNTSRISFSDSDLRIAGILTSAQFRKRYLAAANNENRRLAAAVLRTFLCDDLVPSVLVSTPVDEMDKNTLKSIMDKVSKVPQPTHAQAMLSTQAVGCNNCHQKLDPLGKTFGIPGSYTLSNAPSAGSLVLLRGEEKVEMPVDGMGSLGKALVATPEYAKCQSKFFWKWFIGQGVPFSETPESTVIQEFSKDRNPKNFVRFLVKQPEFQWDMAQKKSQESLAFEKVKPSFAKCNMCHFAHKTDFGIKPWGGTVDSDQMWSKNMMTRLELPEADPKSMPKNRTAWTENEILQMLQYLQSNQNETKGIADAHAF